MTINYIVNGFLFLPCRVPSHCHERLLSLFHHIAEIGKSQRELHILFHKENRKLSLFLNKANGVLDLKDDGWLNALGRLIKEKQFRFVIRMRAIASCCCCPPLKSPPFLPCISLRSGNKSNMPSGTIAFPAPGFKADQKVLSDGKVGEYFPPLGHIAYTCKRPGFGLPMGDIAPGCRSIVPERGRISPSLF